MSKAPLGGRRRVRALLLAGVLTLAGLFVPITAQPAQATAVPCPTTGLANPSITAWDTMYANYGVTLCTARSGPTVVQAKVQILDLTAGADIVLSSYPAATAPDPADNTFTRKLMSQFASSYGVGLAPHSAPFDVAFSATNAGFFRSKTTSTTALSLPEKKFGTITTTGYAVHGMTCGPAQDQRCDDAWDIPKRKLQFNTQNLGTNQQPIMISDFPMHYNASNVTTGLSGYDSGIVGFAPTSDPGFDPNYASYRTYVGLNAPLGVNTATKVFIVTTNSMTVSQATNILKFLGSQSEIQLDGGGSTRMESYAGAYTGAGLNRSVPEAIIAYYG